MEWRSKRVQVDHRNQRKKRPHYQGTITKRKVSHLHRCFTKGIASIHGSARDIRNGWSAYDLRIIPFDSTSERPGQQARR